MQTVGKIHVFNNRDSKVLGNGFQVSGKTDLSVWLLHPISLHFSEGKHKVSRQTSMK